MGLPAIVHLDDDAGVIALERGDETVEGWDSMGHLNLVAALEQSFNVSIGIGDAMEMVTVRRIKDILHDYGVRG